MKKAIIGKKVGMTQIFDEAGHAIPVTVIEAGPCVVTQKKTQETDGYAAIPKLPDDKRHKPLAWILTTQGGNEDNLKPLGPVVRITGL